MPAGIGLVEPFTEPESGFVESLIGAISPLHTHLTDGILHVESDRPVNLTLGQFFDLWQVRLTSQCLGAYCTGAGKRLRVYVNGTQVMGDPRTVRLRHHDQIAVIFGPPGVPANVPSSYVFPPGF